MRIIPDQTKDPADLIADKIANHLRSEFEKRVREEEQHIRAHPEILSRLHREYQIAMREAMKPVVRMKLHSAGRPFLIVTDEIIDYP